MLPNYYEPFPREFDCCHLSSMMSNYNKVQYNPMQTQRKLQSPPSDFEIAPGSPTELDINYTQGFLRTQIGKKMRITFLLGTNTIQDRNGTLEKVGISYVIIKDIDTTTSTLCDIFSIKFVTIFP